CLPRASRIACRASSRAAETASAPYRVAVGLHEQRWNSDLGGIVIGFTGGPVIPAVLNYSVRCADIRRVFLFTLWVGCPSRIRPGVEPSGRNQGGLGQDPLDAGPER